MKTVYKYRRYGNKLSVEDGKACRWTGIVSICLSGILPYRSSPFARPHLILDGHALQVQKPLFPSAHWTEEPKKGRERRGGLSLPDGCDADTGGDSLPVQTVW